MNQENIAFLLVCGGMMNESIDNLVRTLTSAVYFRNYIRDKEIIPKERFDKFIEEAKGVYGSSIPACISNGLEGFIASYRLQTAYACSQTHHIYSVVKNEDIKKGFELSEKVFRQNIQERLEHNKTDGNEQVSSGYDL